MVRSCFIFGRNCRYGSRVPKGDGGKHSPSDWKEEEIMRWTVGRVIMSLILYSLKIRGRMLMGWWWWWWWWRRLGNKNMCRCACLSQPWRTTRSRAPSLPNPTLTPWLIWIQHEGKAVIWQSTLRLNRKGEICCVARKEINEDGEN